MLESGKQLAFLQEARTREIGIQFLPDDFERHLLMEIVHANGFEDRAHATLADALEDPIVAEALLAGGRSGRLAEAGCLLADYAVQERARAGSGEKWFDLTAQIGIARAEAVKGGGAIGRRRRVDCLQHIVDPLPAFGCHVVCFTSDVTRGRRATEGRTNQCGVSG